MSPTPRNIPSSEGTESTRPSDGFRFSWHPDNRARIATDEEHTTRQCRRPRCYGAPVMAFHRSNGWWLYCADHLYGRRIVDGVVEVRGFESAAGEDT